MIPAPVASQVDPYLLIRVGSLAIALAAVVREQEEKRTSTPTREDPR